MSNSEQDFEQHLGSYGIFEKQGNVGVLLIHGITGSPSEMKPLARMLISAGYTVASPQLAGHCSSLKELKKVSWNDWYLSVVAGFRYLKTHCDVVMVSGLSMGALLALKLAADFPNDVAGVATMSATFFYDGWNVSPWKQRFLLPLVVYSPLRYFLSYKEPPPYGIKDERTRRLIAMVYNNNSGRMPEKYGYSEFPAVTIRETVELIKAAKKSLPKVTAPLLILHAAEDDMASVKNAEYLAENVGSRWIERYYLEDTYHVLTLDRRKEDVGRLVEKFISTWGGIAERR